MVQHQTFYSGENLASKLPGPRFYLLQLRAVTERSQQDLRNHQPMSLFCKWGNWGQEKLNCLFCSDSINAGNNLSPAEITPLLCLPVRESLSSSHFTEQSLELNSSLTIGNLHLPSTFQGIRHIHPKQNKANLELLSNQVEFGLNLTSWLEVNSRQDT